MWAAATSPGWHIAQANEIARNRNFLGLVSEQSKYSLADRMIEMEVLACLRSLWFRFPTLESAGFRFTGWRASEDG